MWKYIPNVNLLKQPKTGIQVKSSIYTSCTDQQITYIFRKCYSTAYQLCTNWVFARPDPTRKLLESGLGTFKWHITSSLCLYLGLSLSMLLYGRFHAVIICCSNCYVNYVNDYVNILKCHSYAHRLCNFLYIENINGIFVYATSCMQQINW